MKRKLLILAMGVGVFSLLTGCGKSEELVIWSFTDEIHDVLAEYYLPYKTNGKTFSSTQDLYTAEETGLDYDIRMVMVPTENYQQKLDPVLMSGKDAPDVFALENQFILKYINSDKLMSFAADGFNLQDTAEQELTSYVNDIATDASGVQKAVSMQATPGAFFYRRSIAKEVLGTDDPQQVQQYVDTFDSFMDLAATLKNHKIGESDYPDYRILSGLPDIVYPLYSARENGWIDGDSLYVDKVMYNSTGDGEKDYFDYARILQEGNKAGTDYDMFINETTQWSEGWFADMSGDQVFGYFLPTWGLHYLLKLNAPELSGDWAICEGPQPFFNGGTWLAANVETDMSDAAKEFIEFYAFNEEFAEQWARDTGDFVANTSVVEAIKDDFSDEFLGGQNHYKIFANLVDDINVATISAYDQTINPYFEAAMVSYATQAEGFETKEACMKFFVDSVKSSFPSLKIPQELMNLQ